MTRIQILDPTAPPPDVDADPGPPLSADGLAERRIGIRYDLTWRSFDWVRDEWAKAFEAEGARVDDWCAGDRTGEAASDTLADWQAFVAPREVVVAGLGN